MAWHTVHDGIVSLASNRLPYQSYGWNDGEMDDSMNA